MLIVAGIGCRRGVTADAVVDVVDMALQTGVLQRAQLALLAVPDDKMNEAGIQDAARRLGLDIVPVTQQAMQNASAHALTKSERVRALKGVPSVAETAALAAIGSGGRLLAPRSVSATATCAIATGESEQ